MQTSANSLITKGVIRPSCEISKISLVAGAIMQPFAEMVRVTTGGDMDTINLWTDILVTMKTPTDRDKLFRIIQRLYWLVVLFGSRANGRTT